MKQTPCRRGPREEHAIVVDFWKYLEISYATLTYSDACELWQLESSRCQLKLLVLWRHVQNLPEPTRGDLTTRSGRWGCQPCHSGTSERCCSSPG